MSRDVHSIACSLMARLLSLNDMCYDCLTESKENNMLGPAMALVREGARRGLAYVLAASKPVISEGLKDPRVLAAAAARIGLSAGKTSITSVMRAAANNKMSTALILWELGDVGYELLAEMAAEDAEVSALLTTLESGPPDSVTSTKSVSDIGVLEDEFRALSAAVGICGSWERFEMLTKALVVDAQTRATYLQVKRLGRVI